MRLLAAWMTIALAAAAAADRPVEAARTAYLMGTRVTLVARAAGRELATENLESLLQSLEQSEALLSTWRIDTTLGRLNAASPGEPLALDPGLCTTFQKLTSWHERTGGAFDPAVGPLVDAWGIERDPRVPSDAEIRSLLPASRLSAWQFDPVGCTVTRPPRGRLDSGGFGKGAAFDAAVRLRLPADGWLIDLGGQVGAHGQGPFGGWRVGIADPRRRDREAFAVRLITGSLATSGGSERDRRAGVRRIGHILDPRSGQPAPFDGSVVVWHEEGFAADVLSTALYVMGPEAGLRWADREQIAAVYLIRHNNELVIRSSRGWTERVRVGRAIYTGVSGMGRL
jgi:thiamine biosynthesis lipoprotein